MRAQIRAAWDAASAAPEDGTASGGLGMVLSAYGQSEQARSCYLRARRLDPAEFRWPYYEAISLGDLGRLDEAIGVMGVALALRPDHPEARLRLAEWLAQTGDPARARALYEAVLAADPRRPEARLGLGRLLLEQGDAQGAVDQLRAALDADWRVGEVHYALSRALRELGDRTGAEQHAALFKRFEKRRLHLADPLVRPVAELGFALEQQGQARAAAERYEQALALAPEHLGAHAGLGRLRLAARDPAAAIPHLERAAAVPGAERARLLHRLALAYVAVGRPDAARKALEDARPLASAGVDPGLSGDIEAALRSLQQTDPKTP